MLYDCNICDLTLEEQRDPGDCPRCGGELAPLFACVEETEGDDEVEKEFESLRDLWISAGFAVDDPEWLSHHA
mgnify:CR=1 FL=1